MVEVLVGAGGVAQHVSDGHEEGEEGVSDGDHDVIVAGDVGEECPAGALYGVVGDVEQPESDDEDGDGSGFHADGEGVAEGVANVGGEADEEDAEGEEGGAGDDEGAAATEGGGAAVAVVAYDGLDE